MAENDDFGAAQPIDGAFGSVRGSNVGATKEPGEPDHAGNPGGSSVWYRWVAPADGRVAFTTQGSSFDTVLAVYRGSLMDELSLVASNDDVESGASWSSISFTAVAGEIYAIAVDGYGGATGEIVLAWEVEHVSVPIRKSYLLGRTLSGHDGPINSVAVAGDGAFCVSASADGTLKIWDPVSGREIRTLQGHRQDVWDCVVSRDGRLLVSAGGDGTLKVWDPASGEELRTLAGHTRWVTGCALSPDDRWVVSASADGTLKVWDLANGQELRTLEGHTRGVWDCVLGPDGRLLVSAGEDGTLQLWAPATGERLATLAGHTGWVIACDVSPDGSFIVSAGQDGTLMLWDTDSGRQLGTLEGHSRPVWDCAVSPDASFIVSASDDGTLKIWDPTTQTELETLRGSRCCAVGSDGSVVSGGEDGLVRIWTPTDSTVRRAEAVDAAVEEYRSIMQSAEDGVRDTEHLHALHNRLERLRRSIPTADVETDVHARTAFEELTNAVDRHLDAVESRLRVNDAVEEYQSILRSAEGGVRDAEHLHELRDRLRSLKRSIPSASDEAAQQTRADLDALTAFVDANLDQLERRSFAAPPDIDSRPAEVVERIKKMVEGVMPAPPTDSPLPAAGETPQTPGRAGRGERRDPIDCTVFSPPSVAAGGSFLLQVFAHMPDQATDARALATEFDERATARGNTSLSIEIERGTTLGFALTMPGLDIDQPARSLIWDGRAQGVSFGVTVPSGRTLGTALGRLIISVGRLPVGEITFQIEVIESGADRGDSPRMPVGDPHRYEMSFVSYTRRDSRKVSYCVQVMETYGVRFFQDVLHIPRGARWEQELYRYIDQCDCFLLFWSKKARNSEWIRKEVARALQRQGDEGLGPPAIVPIIIDGPPVPTPWDELRSLQLDDSKIYRVPPRSLLGRLRSRR